MVLKCSLLGHEYGESELEREREERGSQVVDVVREFKTCTRCGDRTVVSENTEVTALDHASGSGTGTDAPDAGHPADDGAETWGDGGTDTRGRNDSADDDPTDGDDSDDGWASRDGERSPGEWPDPHDGDGGVEILSDDADMVDSGDDGDDDTHDGAETGRGSAAPPGDAVDPVDDAIVDVDAGDEPDGRADANDEATDPSPTASPGDDAAIVDNGADAAEPAGDWPETSEPDEGFDAASDGEGDSGIEFDGLSPTAVVDEHPETDEGTVGEDPAEGDETDGASLMGDAALVRPEGSTDGDTGVLYCPNCGYEPGSSGRPGDVCPACHEGYVGER
ncbi:hypothetical protein BRD17_09650 [Halobacteriales archaeon SW_7_68_16]|nr:MAG: hypothetical protein BRD17_09650 [Halobacteriales archaeon SW_7_68_16]